MRQLLRRFIGVFLVGSFAMVSNVIMINTNIVSAQDFGNQNVKFAPDGLGVDQTATFDISNAKNSVDKVLLAIKRVINWVLSLLALVALIMLIYTGVKMLFNSGDDAAISE